MAYWKKFGQSLLKGAALGCILVAVNDSLVTFVIFQGASMLPTIEEYDVGLCEKWTGSKQIRRGDIVVATSPKHPGTQICKRVIALEGDTVKFQREQYVCDGDLLKYKNSHFIPRGHVWLEGDNKSNSHDSRSFGPVPLGLIKSRVFGKLYPLRNVTLFAREPPNEEWADE